MVLSNIKVCSYVTASCISGAPVHLEFAPRGPWARDPVPLRRAPPAPLWPSAPRGPGERDPVPLRRPPRSVPALCPARGWTRSPSGAPPSAPALCPSALSPARACSTWASLLPLPKMGGEEEASLLPSILGGEEASLLPSRKREGRRASIFAGALCRNI